MVSITVLEILKLNLERTHKLSCGNQLCYPSCQRDASTTRASVSSRLREIQSSFSSRAVNILGWALSPCLPCHCLQRVNCSFSQLLLDLTRTLFLFILFCGHGWAHLLHWNVGSSRTGCCSPHFCFHSTSHTAEPSIQETFNLTGEQTDPSQ